MSHQQAVQKNKIIPYALQALEASKFLRNAFLEKLKKKVDQNLLRTLDNLCEKIMEIDPLDVHRTIFNACRDYLFQLDDISSTLPLSPLSRIIEDTVLSKMPKKNRSHLLFDPNIKLGESLMEMGFYIHSKLESDTPLPFENRVEYAIERAISEIGIPTDDKAYQNETVIFLLDKIEKLGVLKKEEKCNEKIDKIGYRLERVILKNLEAFMQCVNQARIAEPDVFEHVDTQVFDNAQKYGVRNHSTFRGSTPPSNVISIAERLTK